MKSSGAVSRTNLFRYTPSATRLSNPRSAKRESAFDTEGMGRPYLAAIAWTRTLSLSRPSLVKTFAQSSCLRVLVLTAIPHTTPLLPFATARIPQPQGPCIRLGAISVLALKHRASRLFGQCGSQARWNRFHWQAPYLEDGLAGLRSASPQGLSGDKCHT